MATKERYEKLKERKAKIEAQLTALEAKRNAKQRKEDTRLKVLIGAGLLAIAENNPHATEEIKRVLKKTVTSKRDKTFLESKGWMEPETEEENTKIED